MKFENDKKADAVRYDPAEYLYCSARIRARENGLIGKEKTARLIDSGTLEAMSTLMSEYGYFEGKSVCTTAEREEMLLSKFAREFEETEKSLPEVEGREPAISFLRYPYDCNNLKSAIKCSVSGAEVGNMLFDIGSVSAKDAVEAAKSGDYAAFPANMAEGAKLAREEYMKTKNPRMVDFILDRACYADMLAGAKSTGVGFAIDYVRLKIDTTNIMSTLRVLKLYPNVGDREKAEDILSLALIPGGKTGIDDLCACLDGGTDALASLASNLSGEAGRIIGDKKASLSECELCLDDLVIDFVCGAKQVPFGAEIPMAYIIAIENSLKNVRIIFASREAGLDSQIIRERMRLCYV